MMVEDDCSRYIVNKIKSDMYFNRQESLMRSEIPFLIEERNYLMMSMLADWWNMGNGK